MNRADITTKSRTNYKVLVLRKDILNYDYYRMCSWTPVHFDDGRLWPNRVEAVFKSQWEAFLLQMRLTALGVACSVDWVTKKPIRQRVIIKQKIFDSTLRVIEVN